MLFRRIFVLIYFFLLLRMVPEASANVSVAREIEDQRIQFGSSQHELSEDSQLLLDQTISLLNHIEGSYTLKVMGYADSHGLDEDNQSLSLQRANEVVAYLTRHGVKKDRVVIQGLGEENPVASNDTEEGRSENRRVEFQFIVPNMAEPTALTASLAPVEPKAEEVIEVKAVEEAPPVVQAEPVVEQQAIVEQPVEQAKVVEQPAPRPVTEEKWAEDTMITNKRSIKRKRKYENHNYEIRKQNEDGVTYVQVSPIWASLKGTQAVGAADNKASADVSFYGEAGWLSFMEETTDAFVTAKAYGSFVRFGSDTATGIAQNTKVFPFGGSLGIGRYFHPSFSLSLEAGYGKEIALLQRAGNTDLDADFIGHAGLLGELIAWRFSELGNIGLSGGFTYYDFGRGVLETGFGYQADLFVDYDFLRVGLGLRTVNLETETYDYDFWQFGPNFRLYF
jgi:hypothetical protein